MFIIVAHVLNCACPDTCTHAVEGQHLLRCRPNHLSVNCNMTRMSIIDINGVLSFYDLEAKGSGKAGTQGEHLAFERKVCSCLCV